MADPFNRAEKWRERASELRAVAGRMAEPDVRASLASIAAALEEHARKIEEVAVKVRCAARAPLARGAWRRRAG